MEEDDTTGWPASELWKRFITDSEGRVWNLPTWLSPKLVNRKDMGDLIRSWGQSEERI